MRGWFRFASGRTVVRRACWYAIGVGALFIAVNHGDAIVRGDVPVALAWRMILAVMVPYSVSTASSVSTLKAQARDQWKE
jgi:hypothetical protein